MWPLIRLIPTSTNIDFVRLAPFAAILSALCLLGSGVSFFVQGMNYGVDFAGGTVMEVRTPGAAPIAQIRSSLTRNGVHDGRVQAMDDGRGALLRFRSVGELNANQGASLITTRLQSEFPGMRVVSQDTVGANVSSELLTGGALALATAILLMLGYIWFRFQLQFGFGAVIALIHDIALTIGMLSIAHIEISTTSIAALLTVIGYSMNEKVITFDRLRENLRKYKTTPLREVINRSENERLSRTLITGTTALLALSGAFFFGGPSLFGLVATMCFGILIGTYSSIYVALPVILLWGARRNDEDATPLVPANLRR